MPEEYEPASLPTFWDYFNFKSEDGKVEWLCTWETALELESLGMKLKSQF